MMDIINLSENNCWLVKLMPFPEKERINDVVIPYQKNCINNCIFGMGWRGTDQNNLREGYSTAYSLYQQIKSGDFVVTRLRNGEVYVGCVVSHSDNEDNRASFYFNNNEDCYTDKNGNTTGSRISYGCRVKKWHKCSIDVIPSEIQGRLSQRRQPTIIRVANSRQQILIRAMYEHAAGVTGNFSEYKVKYNKHNFARCLNYMELEDLVALYIAQQNKGYAIKPSSCKINEIKYEFQFIKTGSKPITCQVKNRAQVNLADYYKCNEYEKIYLFSGLWSEKDAEEHQRIVSNNENNNIVIIKPSELYSILKDNIGMFINNYYSEADTPDSDIIVTILTNNGYSLREERQHRRDNRFEFCGDEIADDDNITQYNDILFNHGIFYSFDFDAIIIPNKEDKDLRAIELANNLYKLFKQNLQYIASIDQQGS